MEHRNGGPSELGPTGFRDGRNRDIGILQTLRNRRNRALSIHPEGEHLRADSVFLRAVKRKFQVHREALQGVSGETCELETIGTERTIVWGRRHSFIDGIENRNRRGRESGHTPPAPAASQRR